MKRAKYRITLMTAALLGAFLIVLGGTTIIAGRFAGAPQAAAIGGPFQLTDQTGRVVTERDLQGHPSLVFFGFTHCPDVCPTTLFDMSEVMRALGADADRTRALFITVDPERDTQAVLKDYLSSFDPHLWGLTGDPVAVAAVAKEYRVYSKKVPLRDGGYTMDHTSLVYLMDKNVHFVSIFNVNRTPQDSAAELRHLL